MKFLSVVADEPSKVDWKMLRICSSRENLVARSNTEGSISSGGGPTGGNALCPDLEGPGNVGAGKARGGPSPAILETLGKEDDGGKTDRCARGLKIIGSGRTLQRSGVVGREQLCWLSAISGIISKEKYQKEIENFDR